MQESTRNRNATIECQSGDGMAPAKVRRFLPPVQSRHLWVPSRHLLHSCRTPEVA